MAITKEVLDELLKKDKRPDAFYGTDGLIQQLCKTRIDLSFQPRRYRKTARTFAT